MKIVIEEDPTLRETQVLIRCRARDPQVLGMVAALGSFGQRLTGEREGQTYLLEAGEVLYAESVDKRTFLYTKAGVYETPLRLYELEERLAPRDFVRASKSAVVNFSGSSPSAPTWAAACSSPWKTASAWASPASTPPPSRRSWAL